MPTSLIDHIESFNRKERHILWEQATGTGQQVALSNSYRAKLAGAIDIEIPPEHLVCVDYHLNWLYGALLAHTGKLEQTTASPIADADGDDPNGRRPYERNQQDIDLVVAFESEDTTIVVLNEAKGFTSWGTKQMESKLRRLDRIVDDATPGKDVVLKLVLTSFGKWSKINVDWGRWADQNGPPFVSLDKPDGRVLIEECDAEGRRKQSGQHVHLVKQD